MSTHSSNDVPPLHTLTDKDSHDRLVKECTAHDIPTIIHVYNSSIPRCQSFLSTLESWATTYSSHQSDKMQFAKMDYTSETSFMFKFAPNQLPITVLMVGQGWARTATGTDIREVEKLAGEMLEEYRKLSGEQ